MPTIRGFDPGSYTNTVGTDFTLGGVYTYNGREFIFVLNSAGASDAIADGDVCAWASASTGAVTNGGTTSPLTGNPVAGVGVGSIPASKYGFLLFRGKHTNVKGATTGGNAVTTGKMQKYNGSAAGNGCDVTAASDAFYGRALSGLSGGRYTVQVGGL